MKAKNKKMGWRQLVQVCAETKDSKQLSQLLELLLTITEREEIADRYLITKALLQGKLTQRKIAEKFGVSIAKITRGSNELKQINADLRAYLKSIDLLQKRLTG